jgi:hypothetical protein
MLRETMYGQHDLFMEQESPLPQQQTAPKLEPQQGKTAYQAPSNSGLARND